MNQRLNAEQLAAIRAKLSKPVLVLAGPGSGKTTTIVNRINWLINHGVDPNKILTVTFSKAAATEMRTRILKLNPAADPYNICTIHAFCYRFLKSLGYNLARCPNWMIKKVIEDEIGQLQDTDWRLVNYWLNEWLLEGDLTSSDILAREDDLLAVCASKVVTYLEATNQFTFSWLLSKTREVLSHHDVASKARQAYNYVLVDEGQDTVKIAVDILETIGGDHFFIVGDPDQTLFRFAGAAPEHNLFELSLADGVQIFKLSNNYRSTKTIVNAASKLISQNYDAETAEFRKELKAANNIQGPAIDIKSFDNDSDEAAFVAEEIKLNYDPDDVFVGARTNAQLVVIERALTKQKIPYAITSNRSFFDLAHIADILAYVRCALNPKDFNSFSRIYNIPSASFTDMNGRYRPTRFLGKAFLKLIESNGPDIAGSLSSLSFSRQAQPGANDLRWFLNHISDHPKPIKYVIDNCYHKYLSTKRSIDDDQLSGESEVMDDLDRLVTLVATFDSIEDFFEFIDHQRTLVVNDSSAVVLSTIHKLKGRERPVVFGIGFNEGTLPHYKSFIKEDDPAAIPNKSTVNDERCLAYVLLTRAKRKVYLSYTKEPSRFLKEMELI